MMYSGLPPRERRAVISSLILGWASAVGAGLTAAMNPTSVVLTEMGYVASVTSGSVLAVTACVAIIGLLRNRYRMEWVASWVAAAAFVPYSITIWSLTVTENIHWLTASFISTVCLLFFVSRALSCAAHAAKLRIAHEASETITSAIESVREEAERGSAGSDPR